MAQARRGSGRSSRSYSDKDQEEIENNGYIRVFMKPLERSNYSVVLGWLGLPNRKLTLQQVALAYGIGALFSALLVYQLIFTDFGYLFHSMCSLIVPLFSIICAFYWLALYFRKSWSTTSVYMLFCACFAGEFLSQCICDCSKDNYITQPFLAVGVLIAVCVASLFSTLERTHSTFVIAFVSFVRFLACTTFTILPQMLRPFLAYFSGVLGVIGAKYMETIFKPPINNNVTQDGKIPVIKRRRSSSSVTHGFTANRTCGRRTSLPALIQKTQTPTTSYESAIIGEAHGLISDMLADSSLPLHVISGLRAVSALLKPPDNHGPSHKPKVSPLVSLSEAANYGSDNEDLPYTGERPSSLPKRLRRSLPPSLIRRMSTSMWTTTTSATGMPTLEPEPCRTRSSSFRHSRENTPGSSPVGSRSNSPSPCSPTTVSLTIPKSRSFSLANIGSNLPSQRRVGRERRSLQHPGSPIDPHLLSPSKGDKPISPLVKGEVEVKEGLNKVITGREVHPSLAKRLQVTSDYESSDSPSSSDLSDTVTSATSPQSKSSFSLSFSKAEDLAHKEEENHKTDLEKTSFNTTSLSNNDNTCCSLANARHNRDTSVTSSLRHSAHAQTRTAETESPYEGITSHQELDKSINSEELLDISKLNQWDYPIFDLAFKYPHTILSTVAYKLFSETGLFDTFRIPLPEFLRYFHELEMGYREKPYHNRVHATDVLHGVYYLITQPIPGFQQVSPDTDFQKGSSSESDSEGERVCGLTHRPSFTAENSYGIMGGNFPALELMALFAAAAMHDYDHPGRTNAFLVATSAPLSILYNDRSVLESHHAASAWKLFLSDPRFNWLVNLDKGEFKRFRFLVVEAILATDLKRHFELLAEFNAKINDEDASGIDWTTETDRLMVGNMVIKMADINGPAKVKDLHVNWTTSISEEFYEQGDEEARMGMPISPYMDRNNSQLAKLQESFINHLVAPLCNAVGAAGLLPGTWVEKEGDNEDGSDSDKGESSTCKDTEDEETEQDDVPVKTKKNREIHCWLTKNLKDNHDMWVKVLKKEAAQKERQAKTEEQAEGGVTLNELEGKQEMEPITEEDTPPDSACSLRDDIQSPMIPTQDEQSQNSPTHNVTSSRTDVTTHSLAPTVEVTKDCPALPQSVASKVLSNCLSESQTVAKAEKT